MQAKINETATQLNQCLVKNKPKLNVNKLYNLHEF